MSPCGHLMLPLTRPSRRPIWPTGSRCSRSQRNRKPRHMDERAVRQAACAMPLVNPSYPPGPYRFIDREYMIIVYRTDVDALKRVVPEPLEVVEPIVKYEFIRMPDSTGFGDYTESGQVIPVRIR